MLVSRSKLYAKNAIGIGLDFLSNSEILRGLDTQLMERNGIVFAEYRVMHLDIGRPDIISVKIYGDVKYWWLLMRLNKIIDPINDLYVGMKLKIMPQNIMDDLFNRALVDIKRV